MPNPGVNLQNKVVVVGGSAGLLGKALVESLVNADARVIAADLSEEKAQSALAKEFQDRVDTAAVDITSAESLTALFESIQGKRGKVDAWVNTTYPRSPSYGKKLEDVSYRDFCNNLDLQLGGYFLAMKQAALFFRKQGHGNVINLSSIYGVVAPRFEIYAGTPMTLPVEYAAVKSGLIHLTRYFAKYFKGSGIRFNCISPGGILDNQPASFIEAYREYGLSKGMLEPKDICGTVNFLLSDGAMHINGQNVIVDDGWTLG